MSLVIVRLYGEVALLLAAALLLGVGARALARWLGNSGGRSWVRLAQALLLAALLLPLPARLALRPDAMFPAPMQESTGPGAAAHLAMTFTGARAMVVSAAVM